MDEGKHTTAFFRMSDDVKVGLFGFCIEGMNRDSLPNFQ